MEQARVAQEGARDKGARYLLVLACVIVVVAGIKAAQGILVPFMVALFIAMVSLPLLNWLQGRGMPTGLAVLATIIAALLVLGAIFLVIGTSIRDFTDQAPKYQARLEVMWTGMLSWIVKQGVDLPEHFTASLINPGWILDWVTVGLRAITAVLSNLFLVLLTIVFILFEAASFPAKLQRALGQEQTSGRFFKIRAEIQRYLGIKTLVSLTTGAIVAASLAILGVDFPLLWGLLAFLMNYIPTLGSILAAIPPVLLGLIQFGPGRALVVAVIFVVVNITLGNLLEPHLMGRRLGLSTLVVFLSLVFWGWVWGPVGMLLSVPLTMILKIMLENTEDLRWVAVLLDAAPRD